MPLGPKTGRGRLLPSGDWNGFPPDGTLSRRPGVRLPAYILCEREWDEVGDATPEPHRGLLWPVEKVADVGVLKSLGYDSRDSLDLGSAITNGGGRRRKSSRPLNAEPMELMLPMLDVDSDLE